LIKNLAEHFLGKTLFISPHFDDACFSAGGLLSKMTSKKVVILTVFSRSSHAPQRFWIKPFSHASSVLNIDSFRQRVINYVSKERQKEDLQFCNRLNAVQNVLPFKDSEVRGYKDSFLTDRIVDKDPVYDAVCQTIEKSVFSGAYDSILCPLAVGNHIDHLIVLEAFLQIVKGHRSNLSIFFYEDLPYASEYDIDFIDSLVQKRIGDSAPLFVDITNEMALKQELVGIYKSQCIEVAKPRILYHAKRLFTLRNKRASAQGYYERFWSRAN
jgi:LmbE family N-acetylglucosaminyl deacetylase